MSAADREFIRLILAILARARLVLSEVESPQFGLSRADVERAIEQGDATPGAALLRVRVLDGNLGRTVQCCHGRFSVVVRRMSPVRVST